MDLDQLPHLETFAHAAQRSSFTAAAQALGLTQAAVSQRIQALEKSLGVPLFQRAGGHVLLTDAGQRLYIYAERILSLYREARQLLTGRKAPLAGQLTLAASSVPGEHLLPALLPVFRQNQPHLQIRVKISDTREVLTQVEHGQAQLGLVGGKSASPHLEFRCFACDKMALVVPAGHRWRSRKRISIKQLCDQPLIVREPGSGSRWCLEHALSRTGKAPQDLNISLELGSNEAIKEAVMRGMGLAVLSTHAVQQELRSGQLYALQVTGLALVRDMFVVWDRRRVLPIPARLFLDFLDPCPASEVKS